MGRDLGSREKHSYRFSPHCQSRGGWQVWSLWSDCLRAAYIVATAETVLGHPNSDSKEQPVLGTGRAEGNPGCQQRFRRAVGSDRGRAKAAQDREQTRQS